MSKRDPRDQRKGGIRNPFQTYDAPFKTEYSTPYDTFTASRVSGAQDMQKRIEESSQMPLAVSFPPHLYIPADAQSVDIRELANVPPGMTYNLIEFTCPQAYIVKFINYSIFFDALMFDTVNLVPTVNNVRVFPWHGDPQQNYKIGLGVGSDLSNSNLIACQLDMRPNDTLIWTFTNNDTVDVAAGVRMVGYIDQSTISKTGRFGG
jgi:hypothetical protein